jgi:hypothetical protein
MSEHWGLLSSGRASGQVELLRILRLSLATVLPELDVTFFVDAAPLYKLAFGLHNALDGEGIVGEYLCCDNPLANSVLFALCVSSDKKGGFSCSGKYEGQVMKERNVHTLR